MCAVVSHQFGGHGFEFGAKEHVQEQGFDDIVTVMTQGDFGGAQFVGDPVNNTPAQTRTQGAHGFAGGDFVFDDGIGVFGFDVIAHAEGLQVTGQDVGGKPGLFLVQVHGDDFKVDGRPFTQCHEHF